MTRLINGTGNQCSVKSIDRGTKYVLEVCFALETSWVESLQMLQCANVVANEDVCVCVDVEERKGPAEERKMGFDSRSIAPLLAPSTLE